MTHFTPTHLEDGSWAVKVGRARKDHIRVLRGRWDTEAEAQVVADRHTAEEHVREANRLVEGLPIQEAMEVGRLAYDLIVTGVDLRREQEDPDYSIADPTGWLA